MSIPIHHLDSIDSTNVEAMRRMRGGERGPLWITAAQQTAGRGRAGRSWSSTPGNFYGSLLVPVACRAAVAHHLSLLMSVAVFDALVDIAGGAIPGLRLKWPNDIQVGAAKLCGLLPESTNDPAGAGLLVVFGIGVNLVRPPIDLGRPVAALADLGTNVSPQALAEPLGTSLLHWLDVWHGGAGFGAIREAWLARAGARGEPIQINAGAEPMTGTFENIDADGALLLRLPTGELRRFTYGDVTLLPTPTTNA